MSIEPMIPDLRHPDVDINSLDWEKWRLTYEGGRQFIRRYLKKVGRREDDMDFRDRRAMTYCPAFAKAAIIDIKNSIFQRIVDVAREGGPVSYQDAVDGHDKRGVDLKGSTMSTFIGRDILPELLTMARVGVFVDMPPLPDNATIADKGDSRPYLYFYKTEDIRSWSYSRKGEVNTGEFTALLLRDTEYEISAQWTLPYSSQERFRYLWVADDGYVHCKFYGPDGTQQGEEVVLPLRKIPFVMLELSESLLADVADYQIAHLNLASLDIAYAIKANFPFYTEQVDTRISSPHLKAPGPVKTQTQTVYDYNNTYVVSQEQVREIRVGTAQGRQYPLGVERPSFIHPSSEPMAISMQKQEQIKAEIRQLVNLAVTNLTPKMASAESKAADQQGLEAGLSYIGLELQHAENKIAYYWAMYEGDDAATVRYPETYSIMGEGERQQTVNFLIQLIPYLASPLFRTAIAKLIAKITLQAKISSEELRAILADIEKTPVISGDPKIIEMDLQSGIVSRETASKARGYPAGEVEQAAKDHAEHIARIAISQSEGMGAARGTPELGAEPKAGKQEKVGKKKRGEEK